MRWSHSWKFSVCETTRSVPLCYAHRQWACIFNTNLPRAESRSRYRDDKFAQIYRFVDHQRSCGVCRFAICITHIQKADAMNDTAYIYTHFVWMDFILCECYSPRVYMHAKVANRGRRAHRKHIQMRLNNEILGTKCRKRRNEIETKKPKKKKRQKYKKNQIDVFSLSTYLWFSRYLCVVRFQLMRCMTAVFVHTSSHNAVCVCVQSVYQAYGPWTVTAARVLIHFE